MDWGKVAKSLVTDEWSVDPARLLAEALVEIVRIDLLYWGKPEEVGVVLKSLGISPADYTEIIMRLG